MHSRNVKKAGLLTFGVGVALVAVASAAFACTSTSGKITMKGTNGTKINGIIGGSVTYQGDGGDATQPNNGYCNNTYPSSRLNVTPTVHPSDFSLTVAQFRCSPQFQEPDKLKAGLWEVRWLQTDSSIDEAVAIKCFGNTTDDPTNGDTVEYRREVLGIMNVDTAGNGHGEYPLPETTLGPGNICMERSLINTEEPGSYNVAPPKFFINTVLI